MKESKCGVSRRKFLLGAGALTAGAVTMGGIEAFNPAIAESAAPSLPWSIAPLDVELVRRRGYENYFVGGCMYGAGSALVETIKEQVGSPWDTIPLDMFKYGGGGVLSWGTICGALNASVLVLSLAMPNYAELGNELIGWYTVFPFPTNLHDSYCKFPAQTQTIANSPLCHASVSQWCDETNSKISSDEKKDRCAKLTGDTAAKAAELINQSLAGTFVPVFQFDSVTANCMSCHTGPDSTLDNEQGKMHCTECHDNAHHRG